MLTELRISNFALIEQLHLEFPAGYVALTGETGAGKSILIDALLLVAGGRASIDLIRSDTEQATVEAAFTLPDDSSLTAQLQEDDLLPPDGDQLVIRRVLSRAGKNKTYVNGALTPIQRVQAFARSVLDIHGQHDQQSMSSASAQRALLDSYAANESLRRQYTDAYETWRARVQELEQMLARRAELGEQREMKIFQRDELLNAALVDGEEEALTHEHQRLRHHERIAELAGRAHHALQQADVGIVDQLQRVVEDVRALAQIDPSVEEWTAVGESARVGLQDLVGEIRAYRETCDGDPGRLAEIDQRLALLQRLQKKYRCSLSDLVELRDRLDAELHGDADGEHHIGVLRASLERKAREVEGMAERLSAARQKAARTLEARLQGELAALQMEHVQFAVQIEMAEQVDDYSAAGKDRVTFLFSANVGEPLQPLAKVASGGELSRFMLGLKSVVAGADKIPVLIFDEVDAGVGGSVGSVIGERLRALARHHQVLCVTHLPQVAAKADAQYVVEKDVIGDGTVTTVHRLSAREREQEIARMLGGEPESRAVQQTAKEMLHVQPSRKTTSRRPQQG